MTVLHVFVTRFNLPSEGVESLVRAREDWLRNRIELFDRYTVPSVRRQTQESAAWLVYVDAGSPPWLLDRLRAYEAEGLLAVLPRTVVLGPDVAGDLGERLGDDPAHTLVTTNLDNDDGLAVDFVERLVDVPIPSARAAIYFKHGLILSGDALYLRRDRWNAFCSVRESLQAPMTAWADWHNLLPQSMPAVELGGGPAWLQVVHGGNVSNRVRGRLVSPMPYRRSFGTLIGQAAQPPGRTLARDRFVNVPVRAGRDAARVGGKRVIMTVGGKEGLDRVKERMAELRKR